MTAPARECSRGNQSVAYSVAFALATLVEGVEGSEAEQHVADGSDDDDARQHDEPDDDVANPPHRIARYSRRAWASSGGVRRPTGIRYISEADLPATIVTRQCRGPTFVGDPSLGHVVGEWCPLCWRRC